MIAAVLLAAGNARRYGEQKLLVPVGGKPLVRWPAEHALAAGVGEVVVVLGREGEAVRAALDGLPVRFVYNPGHAEGMNTSVRAGVGALGADVEAALVLLGDQPLVPPEVLRRLADAYRATGARIVAPRYRGERGNPVLFDASLFPELLRISGDQGARAIIAREAARVAWVDLPEPAPLDVDTPEDRAALERHLARRVQRSTLPTEESEHRED